MAMEMLPSETELLDRQRALQMEAEQVVRDLMLMELAQPLGDPVLVGSAALGLMVWRAWNTDAAYPDGLYIGLSYRWPAAMTGSATSGLSTNQTANRTWGT